MRELNSYYQLCNSTLELSPVPGASSDTSSSPRSSTTEDDLHDVTCHTEQGACNNSKPIYNFSIPDFIKHERQNVASSADNIPLNEAAGASANIQISRESKRRFVLQFLLDKNDLLPEAQQRSLNSLGGA